MKKTINAEKEELKFKKFLKISSFRYIIFAILLCIGYLFVQSGVNGISTRPAKIAFDKAFSFYLAGDCDNYVKAYNVSFSDQFIKEYGDSDWPNDATVEKLTEKADNCKNNNGSILNVKIKVISREKFSDTAFIKAEMTVVNSKGVHHVIPQNFVMKEIDHKWFIDVYCDTENDDKCK